MADNRIVEITAQDIYSIKAAISGGAKRVELCTALGIAGLTPSIGLIEQAVEIAKENNLGGFVDVLIRPREGDFVYDTDEINTAIRDIERAVEVGVRGVVIGALNEDGTIDIKNMLRMIKVDEKVAVGFNRGFDGLPEQFQSSEELIKLGGVRVLTAGGKRRNKEGIEQIQKLVEYADGKIEIMAAGGVSVEDMKQLFNIGVDAV